MDAEIAAQAVDRLWVKRLVHGNDVAVGADGNEYGLAVAARELESQLGVRRWRRRFAWDRNGNPVLIGCIPQLPDSIAEGALDGEVVPLPIDNLISLVLDPEGSAGIIHILVESKNEMRGSGVIPQTFPP